MAGIYLHIPYCKSRCGYCDFFKTTNFEDMDAYVRALIAEIGLRKDYLGGEPIETVYFGGGTPSVLRISHFKEIFQSVMTNFIFENDVEITVECNPDDIDINFLNELKTLGVNRLSMGIQSFDDKVLRFMQRRHNSAEAFKAVKLAQSVFDNLSIDLIYGLPDVSVEEWNLNLQTALSLNVQHISAYHLTYEKDTPFEKLLQKGVISEVDEDSSVQQFNLLYKSLNEVGYHHYEISNFAKEERYSRHNSNYWFGKKYLGLGPSAHSFDGVTRSWNISNLRNYIQSISNGTLQNESEILTEIDRYNEKIMIGLRTMWGVNLTEIHNFSESIVNTFNLSIKKHLQNGHLIIRDNHLFLSQEKFMISDSIISDLFYA